MNIEIKGEILEMQATDKGEIFFRPIGKAELVRPGHKEVWCLPHVKCMTSVQEDRVILWQDAYGVTPNPLYKGSSHTKKFLFISEKGRMLVSDVSEKGLEDALSSFQEIERVVSLTLPNVGLNT